MKAPGSHQPWTQLEHLQKESLKKEFWQA